MEFPSGSSIIKCDICGRIFSSRSNLNRHKKVHSIPPLFKCSDCDKQFTLKHHLERHNEQHLRPIIPLYKANEAQLEDTTIAKQAIKNPCEEIESEWFDAKTAEKKAKELGGELWLACVKLTWGKFRGHSFKWLLENAVGWVVWILSEFLTKGEEDKLLRWQKETLLKFARLFKPVTVHLDKRVESCKKKKSLLESKHKKETHPKEQQDLITGLIETTESQNETLAESVPDFPDDYITDVELLSAAEEELGSSRVFVKTRLTTVGSLIKSPKQTQTSKQTSEQSNSNPLVYEGWHKQWEVERAHGNISPNIKWMRDNLEYGLFLPGKTFKNPQGDIVERKLLKDRMDFYPPPLPVNMIGSIPNMLSFFTTPVFFWRPVGVMKIKIRCPNSNCPAANQPDTYMVRSGYGSTARQVCGLKSYYTLLTERLICHPCSNLRKHSRPAVSDDDSEDDDNNSGQQYSFMAYSSNILMNLSPAVRGMFPAVICGRRAIDKSVACLLDDKINAVSMSKVQRLVQQGHDKWYMERRDLYQTMLFEAHTAKGTPASQTGILQYVRQPGTYTPPIPKPSLPSARVLRRAHLLLEMEKMPDYRASILSLTGEILCIDGTKQVLTKLTGDGQGTMQFVTSVLNEWGQFLTTVVVASECEGSYKRLARGLVNRFKRAGAPAPKIIYADNNCCRDGSSSYLEVLFKDWVDDGMVVRLDIRHWLHRWDKVIIKQTHSKYGPFMSAMSGAVLAYNRDDMMQLVSAIRSGNEGLYSGYTDEQMIRFVKPYQLQSYVRRVTRGVEETAIAIEQILQEFKGPAGNDVDGIALFKSHEAVDTHWRNTASKHLSCMQDPPDIQLYVVTKEVVINGVTLKKYKCRRGSNSLEGLHSHLNKAVPSQCGLIQFQVYLITFAVQWNSRMDTLRVAGGKGRASSCTDPRLIQRLNQQAEVLFGKQHIFEPNFVAPMPSSTEEEEELLGIEYAQCQSTSFTPTHYYADHVTEEQDKEDEGDEESDDEGFELEELEEQEMADSVFGVSCEFAVLTQAEKVTENDCPALQDVLAPSHLHLPGFEEVESLAIALIKLADGGDQYIVSATERNNIVSCYAQLQDHDRSIRKFVKLYESKWGYSLFGRCLGPETPENSAAQKTKFAKRYAPAQQITEESRVLYLLIKMLRNRPPASTIQSPTKQALNIKSIYKRIVDRVTDDPTLSGLNLPLPNINAKSVTSFISKQDKKANYHATQVPRTKLRQSVLSDSPLPESIHLPFTLSATRDQVQYPVQPLVSGKRRLEKRRLDFDEPVVTKVKPSSSSFTASRSSTAAASSGAPVLIKPRPCVSTDQAPVLLVTPSQPRGPSVSLGGNGKGLFLSPPPKPVISTSVMPGKSGKPCANCGIPQCGGKRKRYTITVEGKRKMFTYCPTSGKSTTSGYEHVQYESYEHFKKVVDKHYFSTSSKQQDSL